MAEIPQSNEMVTPPENNWDNSVDLIWLKIFQEAAKKSKGQVTVDVFGDLDTTKLDGNWAEMGTGRKIYHINLQPGYTIEQFHSLQEPFIDKYIRRKK